MSIRNKILIAATALPALAALTACDNIDESERFIPYERPAANKTIVAFDFTGMWCPNCPTGARLLQGLNDATNGHVIVIGVHSRGQSLSAPMGRPPIDLRSEQSYIIERYYKPATLPALSVDGGAAIGYDQAEWQKACDEALEGYPSAEISLTTSYDESSRKLTADYTVTFNEPINSEIAVMLLLTESDIIGPQYDGGLSIADYHHNHVLRASLNGDWGQTLESVQFTPDDTVEGSGSLTLDEAWVPANCHVVGYIYRTSDKHIIQATQTHAAE